MSEQATSSSLSRYRPAVLVAAGAAAAAGIYYLHSAYRAQAASSTSSSPSAALRRSNAVHRQRQRPIGADGNVLPTVQQQEELERAAGAADDTVTELGLPDEPPTELEAEGQRMHELMFAISKNRARNEAVVHRGITCDSCHRIPITGVRYRCANCPDFDLCEDCEAQDPHIATHVFYKVKVPAPWAGKVPQRPWYPGQPWLLPESMPPDLKQRLVDKYPALEGQATRFEGMYLQFVCVANQPHPNDPCKLNAGIDRSAFNECFIPRSSSRLRNNLVLERMFSLFDTNNDGLIDFAEFSIRLNRLMEKRPDKRPDHLLKDCFRALDLDDNGLVSRGDCLTFFRAFYDLDRDINLDHFRMVEDGEPAEELMDRKAPADFVRGGRCLSAYFDYYPDELDSNPRRREDKVSDAFGDLVPRDDDYSILHESNDVLDATGELENSTGYVKGPEGSLDDTAAGFPGSDRLAVGLDFSATNAIRDAVQLSLNEMLDPIFRRDELRNLAYLESAPVRQKYAAAIEDFHHKIGISQGRSVYTTGFFEPKLAKEAQEIVMSFRVRHGKTSFDEVTVGDLRYENSAMLYEVDVRSIGHAEDSCRPAWPDMTMPQNKPDSLTDSDDQLATDESKVARFARMIHVLSALQFDKREDNATQGITLERFIERIRESDERKSSALSKWMCGWIEQLVLF